MLAAAERRILAPAAAGKGEALHLHRRRRHQRQGRTQAPREPGLFWSPDSASVDFFAGGVLDPSRLRRKKFERFAMA
jgi:hypothetical protein